MVGGSDSDLRRDLGVFSVFTIASGTMIGAGIFILPGPAIAGAGPAAALSFGIAGVIALVATMCAVELATAMPKAGGPYYFTSRAMGPLVGTIVGFGAWLALIFKGSFALVGLGWYVTEFSAVPVLGVAVVGGLLLTLINWVGAEESGQLQNLVVIGLITILGVFAGGGFFAADQSLWMPFMTSGVEGVVATTGLVFISYLGIVKATAVAEEVKDPGTTLPRALFGAVLFVTGLYVAVILIVSGVMPIDDVAESTAPVAEAGGIFLGALGGGFIALAGIFATVSTANAAVLSSSRFPFAMSRDGLVSPKLNKTSERFGTPTIAIWLTGGLMVGLVLLFDVEQLAKLGGTFGILVFALLNLTVVLLRSSQPEWYEPAYRVPLSPVLPLVGAAAALLLIPFMGLTSQISAIGFILIGIGWYYLQTRIGEPVKPEHDIRDQILGVQYRQSLEEKQTEMSTIATGGPHILVEAAEGESNPQLVSMLGAFADRLDADVDVLTITEVPQQSPLIEADHEVDADWIEQFESGLETDAHAVVFDHIRTHGGRTDALLESINERTELVVVDWDEPIRKRHLQESHIDEILRAEFPVRLAVVKHRGTEPIEEIIVATKTGPYDQAEVELADAIATATGATLTLVKAVPKDASEETITAAGGYLDELAEILSSPAETELIQTDDIEGSLIKRANEAALLVMGAPSRPARVREFFGQTTDVVAAETESSVLVVKDPGKQVSLFRRLWRRVRRFGADNQSESER